MAVLIPNKEPFNARRGFFAALVCILGLFALMVVPQAAGEPLPSEAQVKAAFLINFSKYVEWPDTAFADANSPIVIAVVGESKVGDEIEKAIAAKKVDGRALLFKRLVKTEDLPTCHILFITAEEFNRSPNLITPHKGVPVLTVGEADNFLEGGGIINLTKKDRKIAMEMNLEAASIAGVKISSRLLILAHVVKGKPD